MLVIVSPSIIRIAVLTALLLGQAGPSDAQASWGPRQPDPALIAQAQQLWDHYPESVGLARGVETLFRIVNTGALPATRENTAAVLAILRSSASLSRDEKMLLIRVAGAQFQRLADPQSKSDIRAFLSRAAVSTEDPVLANAAALMYSEMGAFFPDSLAVLARARANGSIGTDDYYRDLVNFLPYVAGGVEQMTILKLLADGKNSFGAEILAASLVHRPLLDTLVPSAVAQAAAILAESEPTFSSNPGTIGGTDLIRYEYWMNAMVGLNARISGEPEHVVMARLLKIDGANPKALIGVLGFEPNAALVRAGLDRQSLERIDTAIASFAEASKNAWVQEVAAAARANLRGPRE